MPKRHTDEDRIKSASNNGSESTQDDSVAASASPMEDALSQIHADTSNAKDPQRFEQSAADPNSNHRTTRNSKPGTDSSRQSSTPRGYGKRFRPLLAASALILCLCLVTGLIGFGFWVKQLNDTISARLQNALWEIPAKVYARPLEIYAGLAIQPAQLVKELQSLGFKQDLTERPGFYSAVSDTSGEITRVDIYNRSFQFSDGREEAKHIAVLFEQNRVKALQNLSANATEPPTVFRLEPSVIGSIHALQHEDREPVSVLQLPAGFIDTLVAVEDRKFHSHHGISLRGIARAMWVNFRSGRRAQGASTITQQLAKNLFLSPEKTLQRKFTEVVMALLLDFRLSKDEILELYINEVFLAQQGNRAIHGFGLASRFFFDKPYDAGAATSHRGIRHVRVPTTVLAQNDSGIGVKNGVNLFGQKNYIGTFAPPFAVLNDYAFIETLPQREKIAGMAEAVKVGLIRDGEFFKWLEQSADDLITFEPDAMQYMIQRCAELHMHQISKGGDPFETGSARPLDFGHWAAHKLEILTKHRLRHGEAVAIGMALDTRYSVTSGLLPAGDDERVCFLLEHLGFKLWHSALLLENSAGKLELLAGLEDFREHLGGELTITLLESLGKGVEVNQMDDQLVAEGLNWLRARHKESPV